MKAQAVYPDTETTFYEEVKRAHLLPLWKLGTLLTSEPLSTVVPYIWRRSRYLPLLLQAGDLAPVERGGERRALQLSNPGLGGDWATTHTLVAAVQLLRPGETAPAHRHTPAAIRFIMEGQGAYTAVNGERCYMSPGDLVLTPSWEWHDHGNETADPVIWMDGLDVPLVRSLQSMFFQPYAEHVYPVSKPANDSLKLFGAGGVRPTFTKPKGMNSPLLIYPWDQTLAALEALGDREGSPFDGVILEYTNPVTGGHVMPTMACSIQKLRPGERTRAHRQTTSAVYYVLRGEGQTVINGLRLRWGSGDLIALPPWVWHDHANLSPGSDAVLFSIQDTPTFEALGLYREEAHEGPQMIRGEYQDN
jgi:gentisate 1,2-dioxygenase